MMEKMQKNQSDSNKSRLQYDCLLQSTFQMPFNVLTKPQTVYKNIKKSTKAYEHGFCHTKNYLKNLCSSKTNHVQHPMKQIKRINCAMHSPTFETSIIKN